MKTIQRDYIPTGYWCLPKALRLGCPLENEGRARGV